jgi:hypothetical protein
MYAYATMFRSIPLHAPAGVTVVLPVQCTLCLCNRSSVLLTCRICACLGVCVSINFSHTCFAALQWQLSLH